MPVLGIDLGTTFSAVSIVQDGKPVMIPVGEDRIMPSVVGLSPEGRWMVGRPAFNQWVLHPDSTVRSIKRRMGTDEAVLLGGESYSPSQISAMILMALKQAAQQHLNAEAPQAVITVPAYFTDAQRQATYQAGQLAGLEVARIINEPTAAALAYGLQHTHDEVALVYDLGGGTFDVSLVELSGGVVDVRASHGNTHLGGDDFDKRLADWLVEQFEEQHGVDLRGERQALARIQRAAEQAKRELSVSVYAQVKEEYLIQKQGSPLHMEIEVSRIQFVSLIEDLLLQTLDSVDRVLRDGQVDKPDHIMLVGGSTYIPAVQELIANHTGLTPRQDVNPSETVAMGASIQGALIAGEPIDAILVDITPFSLGINVVEFTLLGEPIPDRFRILIPRNTTIPTTRQEGFSTVFPEQKSVKIEVYQGESRVATENTLLGEFLFENLQPEPGEPLAHFTVQFDMDLNGMLAVHTVDRGSGQTSGLTVEASRQRLSQAEIQTITLPEFSAGSELPAELLHEMEILLTRARAIATESKALQESIDAVYAAWEENEEAALREALDELTDVLYDLEED